MAVVHGGDKFSADELRLKMELIIMEPPGG